MRRRIALRAAVASAEDRRGGDPPHPAAGAVAAVGLAARVAAAPGGRAALLCGAAAAPLARPRRCFGKQGFDGRVVAWTPAAAAGGVGSAGCASSVGDPRPRPPPLGCCGGRRSDPPSGRRRRRRPRNCGRAARLQAWLRGEAGSRRTSRQWSRWGSRAAGTAEPRGCCSNRTAVVAAAEVPAPAQPWQAS